MDRTRVFRLPQKIIVGRGTLNTVGAEARALSGTRALLITDPGVYRLGWPQKVCALLEDAGLTCDVFTEVEPNPDTRVLQKALAHLRRRRYDLVVGLGGGSPLDVAKATARLAYKGDVPSLFDKSFPPSGLPLILLPTTAGTGSEASQAVVLKREDGMKVGVWDPRLLTEVAIVDPALTDDLPPGLTAATGVDALTHAIEAYVSRGASSLTDPLALHAVELVGCHLRAACAQGPEEPEARDGMATAALLAGMAFSNAGLGAAHALAYPLSLRYGLAHGLSVGALLPWVMAFNLPAAVEKYARLAEALGATQAPGQPREAVARESIVLVRQLLEDLELPYRLRAFGVSREEASALGREGFRKGQRLLIHNPRAMTEDDAAALFESAW